MTRSKPIITLSLKTSENILDNSIVHCPALKIVAMKHEYVEKADFIIFTSIHAVQYFKGKISKNTQILAIGESTAAKLEAYGNSNIVVPKLHSSEGLLSLELLKKVRDKNIIIVKGVGGRRILAKVLQERGALVKILKVYRREFLNFSASLMAIWDKYTVAKLIIPSVAVFKSLWSSSTEELKSKICDLECEVMSKRIAKILKKYGLNKIKIV